MYPSFDKNTRKYHTTAKIIELVQLETRLNPFYISYDLTPTIEDPALKIVAYGPIDEIDEQRARVLVICGQHGREYVTSELCLTLVQLLQLHVRDYNFTKRLNTLHEQNIAFWVVPVSNPWARAYTELNASNACQRTNKNGVDLNRNFPYIKDIDERDMIRSPYSDDGSSPEDNPGTNPMSEYETIAIAELLELIKPHVLINVHSGSNDILLPYDFDSSIRPPHYKVMTKLANFARQQTCPQCKLGIASLLLYPAYGTLVDYAIVYANVQLAYTLEIFSSNNIINDHNLNTEECKEYYNPKEGDDLSDTLRRWTDFIITLVERLNIEIK